MGTDSWRKCIFITVAVLLANEFMVGLIINYKNGTRDLSSEQDALPPVAIAKHALATNTTSSDKNQYAKSSAAPNINVSDADQLKEACISYDVAQKTHHISYRGVYGSWDVRTKDRHDRESFHLASRKNPWLRTSYVPYSNGEDFTSNFTSPLMFVPAIFNPSHCIHDLLFSLLPMASRGRLRNFQAVAVKRPEWSDDEPVRDHAGDYCTLILRELGWFQNIILLPDKTCLGNLWVPAFMYHRVPRGWAKLTQKGGNDYIHNGDLPLGMIHFFQQQMWKSFITNNTFLSKEKKRRIIFDTRVGLGKNEWTNPLTIAQLVREKLDPEIFVVDIVDDVGALTIKEQAALFQSATILVSPHGGSIANVIFMRPNAIVFELSCGETSWIRDWALDLRIWHSTVRADGSACKVEHRKTYYIQPPSLVNLILDACWKWQKPTNKTAALK